MPVVAPFHQVKIVFSTDKFEAFGVLNAAGL